MPLVGGVRDRPRHRVVLLAVDDQQRTAVGFFVFTFASVHGLRFALPICTRAIPEPATWSPTAGHGPTDEMLGMRNHDGAILVRMDGSADGSAVVSTTLGDLCFDLVDPRSRASRAPHRIDIFPISPQRLPSHRSVQGLVAVLLTVTPQVTMTRLRFRCRWVITPAVEIDSESGECLAGQSWRGDGRLVHVGTEDIDALEARLPGCWFDRRGRSRFRVHDDMTTVDGLTVEVPYVEADNTITLHYIVAENPLPEPVDASTWYAVDIDHDKVITQRP